MLRIEIGLTVADLDLLILGLKNNRVGKGSPDYCSGLEKMITRLEAARSGLVLCLGVGSCE